MPRTRKEDDIRVVAPNEPIEMDVDEAQSGRCAPMSEQARLDVGGSQGLSQQRIVLEVDLPNGQVVGRAPDSVESVKLFARDGHEALPIVDIEP